MSSESSQNRGDNPAQNLEEVKLAENSPSSSQRSLRRGRNSNPSSEHSSPASRRNTDDSLEPVPALDDVNVGAANRPAHPELIPVPVLHNQLIEEEKEKEAPFIANAIAIPRI